MLSLFPLFLLLIILSGIAVIIAERKYIKAGSKGATIINSLKSFTNFAFFGFFIYAFYIRYYKWMDCYNDDGRCYDPISKEIYTEGGMIWIVPALIFFFLGMKRLLNTIKTFR